MISTFFMSDIRRKPYMSKKRSVLRMLHCEVGEGGAASLLVSAFYYVVGSLEFRYL